MIYLEDLLQATGGALHGSTVAAEFASFAFDSRQLEPGQLFLAVKTATGDGHNFIGEALKQGAAGVLCEYSEALINIGPKATTVVVPDVQQALIDYATYILQKYRPKVVGVTGSSGKTTAKEAIAAILQKQYRVFKNFGSYNGRYGLPIALGQIDSEHEVAVLEMACDAFGEIAELARITQPDVGVVTTINQTHLAYLGTLDNIAAEKGRLIEALPFTGSANNFWTTLSILILAPPLASTTVSGESKSWLVATASALVKVTRTACWPRPASSAAAAIS